MFIDFLDYNTCSSFVSAFGAVLVIVVIPVPPAAVAPPSSLFPINLVTGSLRATFGRSRWFVGRAWAETLAANCRRMATLAKTLNYFIIFLSN